MNKQINGLLYYLVTDISHAIKIFWSILLSVLVVCIAFSYYLIDIEDGRMGFGFPFAIYFFCIINGFVMVKNNIPFAITMGATRKNLFISFAIFFFGLSLVKAVIASTFQEIVIAINNLLGIDSFMFLHPAMLVDDNWINRVLIDTFVMFFLFAFMFLMGLLFYRFGFAGGGLVAGILAIALLLGLAKGWIYNFIMDILKQFDIVFFYQVFGVGLLVYLFSFAFIRRITIEKRK